MSPRCLAWRYINSAVTIIHTLLHSYNSNLTLIFSYLHSQTDILIFIILHLYFLTYSLTLIISYNLGALTLSYLSSQNYILYIHSYLYILIYIFLHVYLHTYTQILMLHFSIYNLIFNFFYTYIFILTIDIYILIPIILHLLLPLTFLYLHSYIIQLHLPSHTSGLKLTLSQLQSYTLIIMPINIHLNFHFYILTIIC